MLHIKKLAFFCYLILGVISIHAQLKSDWAEKDWLLIAAELQNRELKELRPENLQIQSSHLHKDIEYIYFQQYFEGLVIYGANGNLVRSRDGHVIFHLENLVNTRQLKLEKPANRSVISMLEDFAQSEGFPVSKILSRIEKGNHSGTYYIEKLPFSKSKASIQKAWYKSSSSFYPCWIVEFESSLSPDHFQLVFSDLDGKLLEKNNYTVFCDFEAVQKTKNESPKQGLKSFDLKGSAGSPAYNVFSPPLEAPSFGERTLIETRGNSNASPFGWHDTNGIPGLEYTITRGNNVHAFQDENDNDTSSGDEPDGGDSLFFDFPFKSGGRPELNMEADVTNLFFWINYLHDWAYELGFDEGAGNFQFNNYGKGGLAGDDIKAQTLDGGDTGNANFSAPRDGNSGRMQMYKWLTDRSLEVNSPESIKGSYPSGSAGFGPYIEELYTGNLVLVNDGLGVSSDACQEILNDSEIFGNIALIDRGECFFSKKVYEAQRSGAIAAVVCNNVDNGGIITMGAGDFADLVTIPSLFLSKENCQVIKEELNKKNPVNISFGPPNELSSGFDNGIIVHEFGHGISLRLAGGASNSGCLNNDEQLGEGWSDFFALVLTRKAIDRGEKSRGIGTYVLGETPDGDGIRRYPYSTDMKINPQTHSHIRRSVRPHSMGEVWAAVLWDLYWEFVRLYGYDAEWKDENSGNVKLVQLVLDGIKIQRCNAGILEARNAVIEADILNHNGENNCVLWKGFARRGLGYDAFGGNTNSRYDNIDGFQIHPLCRNEIGIEKKIDPFFNVGDTLSVSIELSNYLGRISRNIKVTDQIPDGMNILSKSNSHDLTKTGKEILFVIDSLNPGDHLSISYKLLTNSLTKAELYYSEDFESNTDWTRTSVGNGLSGWQMNTISPLQGTRSMVVPGDTLTGQSFLTMKIPFSISNANTGLSFIHNYDNQLGIDGGIVEISSDNGLSWNLLDLDDFLINTYNDAISFDSRYINTVKCFTGNSAAKYSLARLENYEGEDILLRFRFYHQEFNESSRGGGWGLDDIRLGEIKSFGESACATWDDTSRCHLATSALYFTDNTVPSNDLIALNVLSLNIFPNPASGILQIELPQEDLSIYRLRIRNVNGVEIRQSKLDVPFEKGIVTIDISALAAGVYFVELEGKTDIYRSRIVKLNAD